jgi:hypothetical protein
MGSIVILEGLDSPVNANVLEALRAIAPGAPLESAVETADTWQLGTHPDLVEYLWDTLGEQLASRSSRVVYAQPALAHPKTGTIFAFARGTGTLAMRLPSQQLRDAGRITGFGKTLTYPSTVLLASELGPAWAFIEPFSESAQLWILDAYDFATRLESAQEVAR